MNLLGTEVSISRGAFEIYLSGCMAPHCMGCHNPESWDFTAGRPFTEDLLKQLLARLDRARPLIREVWILGGEPLDQPIDDLEWLVSAVHSAGYRVVLFTRYDLDKVPLRIRKHLYMVKTGEYVRELSSDNHIEYGIKLASTNQHCHLLGGDGRV